MVEKALPGVFVGDVWVAMCQTAPPGSLKRGPGFYARAVLTPEATRGLPPGRVSVVDVDASESAAFASIRRNIDRLRARALSRDTIVLAMEVKDAVVDAGGANLDDMAHAEGTHGVSVRYPIRLRGFTLDASPKAAPIRCCLKLITEKLVPLRTLHLREGRVDVSRYGEVREIEDELRAISRSDRALTRVSALTGTPPGDGWGMARYLDDVAEDAWPMDDLFHFAVESRLVPASDPILRRAMALAPRIQHNWHGKMYRRLGKTP